MVNVTKDNKVQCLYTCSGAANFTTFILQNIAPSASIQDINQYSLHFARAHVTYSGQEEQISNYYQSEISTINEQVLH